MSVHCRSMDTVQCSEAVFSCLDALVAGAGRHPPTVEVIRNIVNQIFVIRCDALRHEHLLNYFLIKKIPHTIQLIKKQRVIWSNFSKNGPAVPCFFTGIVARSLLCCRWKPLRADYCHLLHERTYCCQYHRNWHTLRCAWTSNVYKHYSILPDLTKQASYVLI